LKKNILYWCPFLSNVATIKAVINSAYSLKKYGNFFYFPIIINAGGEFDDYLEEIKKKNIEVINLNKKSYINKLPKYGYIGSRFSYFIIFFLSFFPLIKILNKYNKNNNYFIIHLISSLPLILSFFFKFEIKFILRISGFPKLNFIRKYFWKFFLKNIYLVTSPTQKTYKLLVNYNLVKEKKIKILRDPVICIEDIKSKNEDYIYDDNFCLSIGRLSKQKNFSFLVNAFKNKIFNKTQLLILGDGEEKKKLLNIIEKSDNKNIKLLGYKKNIMDYLIRSNCFILSSLWEDPGFVLIEAAYARTPIISSDCPHGPSEFLENGRNGYLYTSNNLESFINVYNSFLNEDKKNIKIKSLNALKAAKNFSIFQHYKCISNILR
jgi:glycosyltransferase involved in cell wall biosynthesis